MVYNYYIFAYTCINGILQRMSSMLGKPRHKQVQGIFIKEEKRKVKVKLK